MTNTKLIILTLLAGFYSYCQEKPRIGLTGNNTVELIQDKKEGYFTDPVDDTIHFKKVVDNIYKGLDDKVYILSMCSRPSDDGKIIFLEYYKDMSNFLDLKTYKPIKEGFFRNKGKVYMWGGNSDGDYPIEVVDADPETFIPFTNVGGGVDKQHVFYGGVPDDFEIIKGADPKTIKVLNPERGCWNCGNCYFVDSKSVYFGLTRIEGADPKTFQLVNEETVDAKDKHGAYFDGILIR